MKVEVREVSVILSFRQKQAEKKVHFEKTILKWLPVKEIEKEIEQNFYIFFIEKQTKWPIVVELCFEIAIESYLLGASFSRLGYYGMPFIEIKERSIYKEALLIEDLYDYLMFLQPSGNSVLYEICREFVSGYFDKGYQNGKKRYKLKM